MKNNNIKTTWYTSWVKDSFTVKEERPAPQNHFTILALYKFVCMYSTGCLQIWENEIPRVFHVFQTL